MKTFKEFLAESSRIDYDAISKLIPDNHEYHKHVADAKQHKEKATYHKAEMFKAQQAADRYYNDHANAPEHEKTKHTNEYNRLDDIADDHYQKWMTHKQQRVKSINRSKSRALKYFSDHSKSVNS